MKTARVMFVMQVSCVVEVEIPDDLTDPAVIADVAYQEHPGFTDPHWNAGDVSAYDDDGEPYMIEIEES